MPAASNISINDATPAAHVYTPTSISPQLSTYRNVADATISAGEESLSLSLSRASANRATNRVKITLAVPHEQTVDSVVSVRSTARMNCEIILPDDMTQTERDDFAALVSNAFDHADVQGYFADLISTW